MIRLKPASQNAAPLSGLALTGRLTASCYMKWWFSPFWYNSLPRI